MKRKGIGIGLVLIMVSLAWKASAQPLLLKPVSIEVMSQKLPDVLEIISAKGNFYFSYHSAIISRDSLVTYQCNGRPLRQVLGDILGKNYEFIESGNYIIIRRPAIRLTEVKDKSPTDENVYYVSGYVYDQQTGIAIPEASIYEKKMLASAITDENGYFHLKLKSRSGQASLTVSKSAYSDTIIQIEPRYNQQLVIAITSIILPAENIIISPGDYQVPKEIAPGLDSLSAADRQLPSRVELTPLGRFLLSSRLKMNSLNIGDFFASRPFQVSLVPGLSSHGKLSSQVTNKISLNVFGGYTGGLNGVELGGLFNIDKRDVRFAQFAGLFNLVGGSAAGIQVAGIHNTVLGQSRGFQAAGISNLAWKKLTGFQVSGIYNHSNDSLSGLQVAGIANFNRLSVKGVQIGGIVNFSYRETSGAQIAGIINYSKRLKGLQLGLINIADSSSGYSIGLINIILKGYHKLALSTNEFIPYNAAFKTGNSKLYSILTAGADNREGRKLFAFGYGLGSALPLGRHFEIQPELTSRYLYAGDWEQFNLWNRASVNLTFRINRWVSITGGPAYSVLVSDQANAVPGYRFPIQPSRGNPHQISNRVSGWLGWEAGVQIF